MVYVANCQLVFFVSPYTTLVCSTSSTNINGITIDMDNNGSILLIHAISDGDFMVHHMLFDMIVIGMYLYNYIHIL